jgi:hypothetical protein
MLQEVIKQTQKTISILINEDINYFIQRLNNLSLEHSIDKEKIQKLSNMFAQYQGTMKELDNKNSNYQNKANRLTCPRILDISRLESMTREPTKNLYLILLFLITNRKKLKEMELKVLNMF